MWNGIIGNLESISWANYRPQQSVHWGLSYPNWCESKILLMELQSFPDALQLDWSISSPGHYCAFSARYFHNYHFHNLCSFVRDKVMLSARSTVCGLYWLMGYNVIVSTWINYSFNINEKMNIFVIPLTRSDNPTLIPLFVPTQVMSAQEGLAWSWYQNWFILIFLTIFFLVTS